MTITRPIRENVRLSSGRTIAHTRLPNGATDARPTTGSYAMTRAEFTEYNRYINRRN